MQDTKSTHTRQFLYHEIPKKENEGGRADTGKSVVAWFLTYRNLTEWNSQKQNEEPGSRDWWKGQGFLQG